MAAVRKRREGGIPAEGPADEIPENIERGHGIQEQARIDEVRRTEVAVDKSDRGPGNRCFVDARVAVREAESDTPQPDGERDEGDEEEKLARNGDMLSPMASAPASDAAGEPPQTAPAQSTDQIAGIDFNRARGGA